MVFSEYTPACPSQAVIRSVRETLHILDPYKGRCVFERVVSFFCTYYYYAMQLKIHKKSCKVDNRGLHNMSQITKSYVQLNTTQVQTRSVLKLFLWNVRN